MPSGHKKKNFKPSAVSRSQQRNETMGKENHYPAEDKAEANLNWKKGKKKHYLVENEAEEGDQRSRGFFFYCGLAEEMNAFERNRTMGKENRYPSENKSTGNLNRKKGKEKPYLAEKEAEGDRNRKEGKKKSEQENKASFVSSPRQNLLRSNMQLLKTPSLGNETIGKENHYPYENKEARELNWKKGKEENYLADKEVEGDQNNKDEKEKTVETAAADEMDEFESEGVRVSSISSEIAQYELENPHNLDNLKLLLTEKSGGEIHETMDLKGVASSGEEYLPKIKVFETGEAVVDKANEAHILEANESAYRKEDKLMVDEGEPIGASQNDEVEAISPKIEIPQPPIVVRRASVWNCCGLVDAFKCFQP